jgi:CheY-like chemotaxis protein
MKEAATKARSGKILVVEDNSDSRDLLAKLLAMSGYDVLSAPDGEIAYATALQQLPDLIITDINMPRMDGIALLRKVRLESVLDRTAVFVVTAFGREAAREAMEEGADAATAKPFDFETFVETVNRLMFTRQRLAVGGSENEAIVE